MFFILLRFSASMYRIVGDLENLEKWMFVEKKIRENLEKLGENMKKLLKNVKSF